MDYKELVETYERIDSTPKRLDKTYYVSELLRKTKKEDIDKVILLLQGMVFPKWDKKTIGIASNLVIKAVGLSTGKTDEQIKSKWKEIGDLGKTAEAIERTQNTLFSQKLTITKVFETIKKLSEISGKGSTDIKLKLIANLLSNSSLKEARYIVRTLLEDLRIGVAEGTLRDAIAWTFFPKIVGIFYKCENCGQWMPNTDKCIDCRKKITNKFKNEIGKFKISEKTWETKSADEAINGIDKIEKYDLIFCDDDKEARKLYNFFTEKVQQAYDVTNDFSTVAKSLAEKGIKGLDELKLMPGKPIKVMLYQKSKGIKDAFETVGKPAAIEYKYDGFRLQIHKKEEKISLFTRRLEDVTKQFPDVVKHIKRAVKGNDFILDSEVVGVDKKTGKFKPFQEISQRIKRKYGIEKMAEELPILVNVFDIIEYEGKNLLKTPFSERRGLLEKILKADNEIKLADQFITSDEKSAEKFYRESLAKGNEGIMVKKLNAEYKPGSRVGYGVKVKPVMETLDLVITGAEWGTGKRSGWFSSFIISCRDEETGEFREIGKFGTGVKEIEGTGTTFNELTEILKELVISEKGKGAKIKPEIVVEINYEEIQKSPTYSSGYALRFPRFVRLRQDKNIEEASTIQEINSYYENQRSRN